MEIIKKILAFIREQIFGMTWLKDLVGEILFLISEDFAQSQIGVIIHFTIYNFIKISLLLCVLVFIISYIQSYFPPERTKKILSKFRGIKANFLGAIMGVLTPFCACSSIPLFIGFTRAKISPGVTFSFLIASPLIDLGAFVLLTSVFGIKVAIAYVIVGIILAVIGGTIIEKTNVSKHIESFVFEGENIDFEGPSLRVKDRISYAKEQTIFTFKKVVLFILLGITIGSLIRNVIPGVWLEPIRGVNNIFSVPLATLIGVPLYSNIFGAIPIAQALYAEGVGIGTILAFMMSGVTLSIPSLVMLRTAVKPKLLISFIAIVITGIIIIGYLFNTFHFIF